ncbi:MAG TPA: thermonuclease family protein [Pyrinomonadaceae bacterium]|nr:thermonuclease family protein [Pyrinomonadaceae bacterium]
MTLLLAVTILAVCCSRGPQINPTPSPPQPNRSDLLAGRVVRIADGDTVTLLDANNTEHRIRLQGIDAPESHQDFGAQSKKNLSDMIYNQEVTADCDKTDQYGRQVCKILLKDKDINLEQIKAGMAWHYKEYEREQSPQDREVYARAEDEAHRTRRGLWADPNPVEPGEFRREQRRERKAKR